MSTHDYILANQVGSDARADLNLLFQAIVSQNSSATEPTTMYAYMMWYDTSTTPPAMKQRNAANTAWEGLSVAPATAAAHAVRYDQSFGLGQTWQGVTRVSGTTYYNTTGKAIELRVLFASSAAGQMVFSITVGGVAVSSGSPSVPAINYGHEARSAIPAGASYVILATTNCAIAAAAELR